MNTLFSTHFWTSPLATLLNLALAITLGSITYGEKGAIALVAIYLLSRLLPLAAPAFTLSPTRRERLLSAAKLLGLPLWLMIVMLLGVVTLALSLGIWAFEKSQAQLSRVRPGLGAAVFKDLQADIAHPQTVRLMATNAALFGILLALLFAVGAGH